MPTPHVPGDPMAASHSGRPPAVRSGRAAAPAAAAPPGQPPAAHPHPAPAVPQTCTLVPTLPPSQPVLRARDHNPSRTSSELLQNPGSAEKDSQALGGEDAAALIDRLAGEINDTETPLMFSGSRAPRRGPIGHCGPISRCTSPDEIKC